MQNAMAPPLRRTLGLIVSFLAFQGAWFACVLGAARGRPDLGVAAALLVCGVQLALSAARREDLVLTSAAVALGLIWDTAMLRFGVVDYAAPGPLHGWAPSWILALWVLFAMLLRGPLQWLHGRTMLAALLGGVGGPLSYLAAVRLGAGTFRNMEEAMWVLGLGWAVMTPLLVELARRLQACRTRTS